MGICLAVLFCSLAPVQSVNAAAKTINLTVRYKGKNVTFEAYRNPNTSKTKIVKKAKTYAAVKKHGARRMWLKEVSAVMLIPGKAEKQKFGLTRMKKENARKVFS